VVTGGLRDRDRWVGWLVSPPMKTRYLLVAAAVTAVAILAAAGVWFALALN